MNITNFEELNFLGKGRGLKNVMPINVTSGVWAYRSACCVTNHPKNMWVFIIPHDSWIGCVSCMIQDGQIRIGQSVMALLICLGDGLTLAGAMNMSGHLSHFQQIDLDSFVWWLQGSPKQQEGPAPALKTFQVSATVTFAIKSHVQGHGQNKKNLYSCFHK